MSEFDADMALGFDPFAGDETYCRALSDKIVIARKDYPNCQICHGPIAKGERHRARSEHNREDDQFETWRFCSLCCDAMRDGEPNLYHGYKMDWREYLGEVRRNYKGFEEPDFSDYGRLTEGST